MPERRKLSIPGYRQYRNARRVVLEEERACWICGGGPTPDDPLTADHVLPRARGGGHERTNLRAAHASCNSARGDRDPRPPGIRVV